MNDATRTTHPVGLLRLPAVLALVGIGSTTLYRWIKAGMFPKPYALTPTRSTVAWSAAEVHAWIASKMAMNDGTSVGTSAGEVAQAA